MERFMWTILCSVFVLFFSSIFFYILRFVTGKKLLAAVSYKSIKEIFDSLSNNSLPDTNMFFEIYKDFLILSMGIYFFSVLIGFLGKRVALSNLCLNYIPFFKYKNYWYYFLRGKTESARNVQGKQYWYTVADVLIQQDDKTKMYTGRVTDYYISSDCNQLETIFLENTNRYKFNQNGDYDLVQIPGDIFYIPYNKILNINLTYVRKEKDVPLFKKLLWWINEGIYSLIFLFLLSSIWVEDLLSLNTPLLFKVFFYLNAWIVITLIRSIFRKIIFPDIYGSGSVQSYFIAIIFFILHFFWILQLFNFWLSLLISLLWLIGMASVLKIENRKNSQEPPKQP